MRLFRRRPSASQGQDQPLPVAPTTIQTFFPPDHPQHPQNKNISIDPPTVRNNPIPTILFDPTRTIPNFPTQSTAQGTAQRSQSQPELTQQPIPHPALTNQHTASRMTNRGNSSLSTDQPLSTPIRALTPPPSAIAHLTDPLVPNQDRHPVPGHPDNRRDEPASRPDLTTSMNPDNTATSIIPALGAETQLNPVVQPMPKHAKLEQGPKQEPRYRVRRDQPTDAYRSVMYRDHQENFHILNGSQVVQADKAGVMILTNDAMPLYRVLPWHKVDDLTYHPDDMDFYRV
jgi:hypothetical protein